jgi:hypothetical protein
MEFRQGHQGRGESQRIQIQQEARSQAAVYAMTDKGRKKWRILGVATVIFLLVAGIAFVIVPVQKSKRLEQALNDRFGWSTDYQPVMDGTIPPERMEAFIRIREAVQPNCRTFQGILDDIISLEAIEADKEMSAGEKTSESLDSLKSMFSAAPAFLEFMDARNTALLENDMGLGEYIYLYLASYGPQLAREADSQYADMEEAFVSPRTRHEFAIILESQLASIKAAGQESAQHELRGDLRNQIEELGKASGGPPWPEGPVGRLRDSLIPYQERIEDLYCSGIVKTELLQKNRGLNFGG